jgi:hypothetical protein
MFAAASLGLAAVPVHAQISKAVLKCEDTTNKTLGKFIGSKTKCFQKCIATQRKAVTPAFPTCFPPYTDPTENACITGSLKGAEAKAGAGIAKACAAAASCPACYTPTTKCSDASGGNPFVQSTETTVDAFGPILYCVENGGNVPSKTDGKCEDGLTKALVKFVGAKGKCYQKCNDTLNKGTIPAGSCTPPASDPATATCVSTATTKANASIDKACFTAPATAPACLIFQTSAGWTTAAEASVDATTPTIYCATPPVTFAHLVTTNLPGTSNCGSAGLATPPSAPLGGAIYSDTACTTKLSDLGLACLDIGGGNAVSVPPGPVVDGASTVFDIAADQTTLVASSGTGKTDCTKGAGPGKHCIGPTNNGASCTADSGCDASIPGSCALDANCFFGPPLPIPNGGLSTCVVNVIQTDGSGTGDLTTGASSVSLPLFSRTHLTGNAASPCPKCVSGTCNAGPNAGLACTGVGTLGTTLDCPPPPATLLSPFSVPLNPLSTAGDSMTSASGNFCPGQSAAGSPFGFSGAFGFGGTGTTGPLAQCIKENGTPAGNLTDGNPHPAVLGNVFCIPATGSAAIDGAADLPGPGAITLNVNAQATH